MLYQEIILKRNTLNFQNYFFRLQREALKQSATDPLSGKIDVGILTTGMSSAARKRRLELGQAVKKIIDEKGKVPHINYQKLFSELRDVSDMVNINFISSHSFNYTVYV